MDLLETMLSAVKGGAGQQLASQFGLDTNQIGSVVTAVAPALANGLKDKLSSGGGGGIMELLNSGSLQKFADDPATIASPAASLGACRNNKTDEPFVDSEMRSGGGCRSPALA